MKNTEVQERVELSEINVTQEVAELKRLANSFRKLFAADFHPGKLQELINDVIANNSAISEKDLYRKMERDGRAVGCFAGENDREETEEARMKVYFLEAFFNALGNMRLLLLSKKNDCLGVDKKQELVRGKVEKLITDGEVDKEERELLMDLVTPTVKPTEDVVKIFDDALSLVQDSLGVAEEYYLQQQEAEK